MRSRPGQLHSMRRKRDETQMTPEYWFRRAERKATEGLFKPFFIPETIADYMELSKPVNVDKWI